jgi:hypothetical protein
MAKTKKARGIKSAISEKFSMVRDMVAKAMPQIQRTAKTTLLIGLVASAGVQQMGCETALLQIAASYHWEDESAVNGELRVSGCASQFYSDFYEKNYETHNGKLIFPNGRINLDLKWKNEYRNKLDGAVFTMTGAPEHLADADITIYIKPSSNGATEISDGDFRKLKEIILAGIAAVSQRGASIQLGGELSVVSDYSASIPRQDDLYLAWAESRRSKAHS